MLLMLKSLVIALLLSSVLEAGVTNKDVEGFLKRSYAGNKNIKSITIKVVNKSDVKGMKGWSAFIVDVFAVLNKDNRKVKQKMIWFSNGVMITPDLINIKTGESVKDLVAPPFVAIFSDPLCPFCKSFVQEKTKVICNLLLSFSSSIIASSSSRVSKSCLCS